MNLVDTSNADVSLIQLILTSPSVIVLFLDIVLLFIILKSAINQKTEDESPFLALIAFGLVAIGLIAIITIFLSFGSKIPTYTYQDDAKVLNIEPKDENGKQDMTLKNGKDLRKISLYSENNTENLQKGDDVSVKITYSRNILSFNKPFYINDNDKPRKHIRFKDMNFYEDVEVSKK